MPVIFDYQCSDCNEVFEAMTQNADTLPVICAKCKSETATFKKLLVGPRWIEGTTPGSRPISSRAKVKNVDELVRDTKAIDPHTTKAIMTDGK